jgi:hypothetical protein
MNQSKEEIRWAHRQKATIQITMEKVRSNLSYYCRDVEGAYVPGEPRR